MNIRPTVVSEGQYPRVTGGPFPDGVGADVTSLYGPRVPFMTPQGMTSDFHSGLDLYRADPPPLVALTRGAVLYAYPEAHIVSPGGHGSGPLGSYPAKLVGAREVVGTGKARHMRSAFDVAGAASLERTR